MSCLSQFKSKKLHRYIQCEAWSSACARCESHPKEARMWTTQSGFYDGTLATEVLPLHMVCCLKAPSAMYECLLYAYPESLKSKELRYGRLPLHLACIYGANINVIKLLLFHFTSAAGVCDAAGRTPIFYALATCPSYDVVKCLLKACPEAARIADFNGYLPLHAACNNKGASEDAASEDIILLLLDSYPESWNMRTKDGSLPAIPPDLLVRWFNERQPAPEESEELVDNPECFMDKRDEPTCYRETAISGQTLLKGRFPFYQETGVSGRTLLKGCFR
uniref:Uncharacterized protein n=1 Tax=Helicotheca tamesis TaxID=374047 RepID=A0A7S2HPS3_9STRA|mmetsp:Transcript_19975/g.27395  ORF Transcript_19975/g.27395 Transcript_19975/m.27395 type:complete len:278 (+) Transcript_19975:91-924(+)